ncbi:methylenetetrahydrofolate reductase [Rhizobiaceae bacterium]|nr:methylenetetrahydrofolate reductase [Rhizobiaceae bacterium]
MRDNLSENSPQKTVASGVPETSVEFFPVNGLVKERALMTAAHALKRFSPDYLTVTCGAGGDGGRGTLEWAERLIELTEVPTACHFTLCSFTTQNEVLAACDGLWAQGIRHLVLLRGDAAGDDNGLAGFGSVADAVRAIRRRHAFEISVSAYPEVHPKAQDAARDLDVLAAKQDAGARRAITQFFFDNADFYRFRDRAEARGIRLPLVPGIMPITNFAKISNFSKGCGARVPDELGKRFAAAGDDKSAQSDVARAVVEAQVRDLAANDVDAIHVYSMNRVDLTADTLRAFQACFDGKTDEVRLFA